MYTVKALGDLSGVSTRTLRYYDSIDLLKPAETNESGYRLYDKLSIDRLQQILFYKELGFSLKEIKESLDDPTFDIYIALEKHKKGLVKEQKKIQRMIQTIDKTLLNKNGMIEMTDREKFEGLKTDLINKNDEKYGEELTSTYDIDQISKAKKQFLKMTKEDYNQWKSLEQAVIELLKDYLDKETLSEKDKMVLGLMHREWLSFTWDNYSKDMHRGLSEMYLADERFTQYYDDRAGVGATKILVNAVDCYLTRLD